MKLAATSQPPHATPNPVLRVLTLAILLFAFAVRTYRLDFQSLWSDEGISLLRAVQTLPDLLRNMPVEHTPGYFVLLHGWLPLVGDADYATRFLSLVASTLAVALIMRLGADLQYRMNPTRALVVLSAGALLASSAFQVWYAQEVRMYSWLLAATLLSSWCLWRLLAASGRATIGWGAGYAIATAAAVYLHMYGALTPIAQTVFVVGWVLATRNWSGFLRWLAAAVAALLLFAPWLPRALEIFSFTGWRQGGVALELPWRYLTAYTAGETMTEPWRGWLPWLYLALAVTGIFYWVRSRRAAGFYLISLTAIPLAIAFWLAIRNPDYHERYTIFIAAPLLLLCAGGVGLLDLRFWRGALPPIRRWLAPVAALIVIGLLVVTNLMAVQRQTTDSSLHKPDFRGAAARIESSLRPNDVVLVDGPDPKKVFLHYYKGSAPIFAISELQNQSLDAADGELQEFTAGAERVWEVLYFHLPATAQVWLATRGWATEPTDHNGIRVSLYGLAGASPPVTRTLGVGFGAALTLEQAEVSTTTPTAGELLNVSTHWFVHEPAPEYKFSLRLLDPADNIVQSVDYVPQNWFAPTSVWVVGQSATDQRGLVLNPALPPGSYRLTLRLYDPSTGAAVDTVAGQDVELAQLEVRLKE
ncbi:MAG: glycosyltransferase family 39 protein [Anaerolineales bacterium]|nr:glycosyltransferase family 39 protein [Anaerolineales bacterium]